ncbi:MAG: hypothetical protein Q8M02_14695 [Candidatus Didemnitutus sp.]|nr:hypothetical protein [Candidatus Didemnitutus sp.]
MKKTTTKKTAPKPAAAPKAVAKTKAPAKKKAAPASVHKKIAGQPEAPATIINARIKLAFGCHLYLRGEGPGLSWDHGVAMDCIAADSWVSTLKGATLPVVFKVLLDDKSWCKGNDYVVEPGQSVTITPSF